MTQNINLQTYLKQYSSINNKFIDDFFGLYDMNTNDTDFVINIDVIANWLKSQKYTLNETLRKSYRKDIDYKITKQVKNGERGRPSEIIMLTPECFKRLCMLSRTEKAEEVRTYFITIEQHLNKYKSYIIDGLNKKIKKYESELKPNPKVANKGVIYVLKTTEDIDNVYKIGRTKKFTDRLKVHQSSHPDKLEIAYVYETDNVEAVESCIKDLLKDTRYRKRREFYEVELSLLKQFIKNCDCMHMIVRSKTKNITDESCKYVLHVNKDIN
jgi:phage anti-repressor protein